MSGCSIKILTSFRCYSSLGAVDGLHERFFLAALNTAVVFVGDKLFTKALITLTLVVKTLVKIFLFLLMTLALLWVRDQQV